MINFDELIFFSLDYDECASKDMYEFVKQSRKGPLARYINKKKGKQSSAIIMIGSARQSHEQDIYNDGQAFIYYQKFCEKNRYKLDDILYDDYIARVPAGWSMKNGLQNKSSYQKVMRELREKKVQINFKIKYSDCKKRKNIYISEKNRIKNEKSCFRKHKWFGNRHYIHHAA